MPSRAPTACRKPGCPGHVRNGSCSVCGSLKVERMQVYDNSRGTAAQRGYGYRWQQLRAAFLLEHPVCEECLRYGRATSATDVDHIRPKRDGGTDDASNLQALCHECHSRKTMAGG